MKNLFLFFILFISFYKYSFSKDHSSTVYAYVNGLVCDFCARALEKTIGKNDAVKSIKVDLKEKIITINFNENKKSFQYNKDKMETIKNLVSEEVITV